MPGCDIYNPGHYHIWHVPPSPLHKILIINCDLMCINVKVINHNIYQNHLWIPVIQTLNYICSLIFDKFWLYIVNIYVISANIYTCCSYTHKTRLWGQDTPIFRFILYRSQWPYVYVNQPRLPTHPLQRKTTK